MATMTTTTPASPPTSREASPRELATRRDMAERSMRTVSPRVDIFEAEKAYVLLADMPGVLPDGLDVIAERDELIIRGRVEPPATTPDYQEFELASYHRAFTLTEDLDTDAITAKLRDGVLRVEIPKSGRMQAKKIPVRIE
jgi:HSP20 family molecular chaperone IbpA